jgi:uncharacterized SAM-dependent methyltransferase
MNNLALTLDRAEADDRAEFKDAVLAGLARTPRAIPAKFLYDARGSALFDQICELPEYYLTRTETSILRQCAAELAVLAGPGCALVEFGSGSASSRARPSAIWNPRRPRPSCAAPVCCWGRPARW